jgi:nicotinamide mononucleotide adenylyltransferase
LQEEKPSCFNPTYIIGAHEDLIFSYQEHPTPAFEHGVTRMKWPAAITPENWHDVMQPHFIPWSESEQGMALWEKMDTLLSF